MPCTADVGADRHIVVAAPDFPETVGRHLAEIAADAGRTPFEQLVHFALNATELRPAGVRFRPAAGNDHGTRPVPDGYRLRAGQRPVHG